MGNAMFEETTAKRLVELFGKKQQGGHFACPRCGKMKMNAESVTHNALSRRATVYVCDACGMQEALEDMMDSRTPLAEWAIAWNGEAWGVKVLELHHLGRDSWDRPVYECGEKLYVDIDPRQSKPPQLCTKQGSRFNGEPCDPIPDDVVVEFVPERDTWPF